MNKDLLVNRITSGILRCSFVDRFNNKTVFVVKAADAAIRYEAEEVYEEALEQAQDDGMFDEDGIFKFLIKNKLWNQDKQLMLEGIPSKLEDMKVRLFELTFKSNERKTIKRQIELLKQEYEKLYTERHAYNHATAIGYATLSKNYFLLSNTLYFNGALVNPLTEDLSNKVFAAIGKNRIDEKTMRELARTDPWRSLWNIGKTDVFGCPASCFTEEQKALCLWSKMYDNVYEHSESPVDYIIEDDDMLDGWFICQKRKRESNMAQKEGDGLLSKNMARADEVYLVADSIEDARKIEALNAPMSKIIKAQRANTIGKKGEVKEAELPDRIQQQIIGGNQYG
jgi:hypothetical protein